MKPNCLSFLVLSFASACTIHGDDLLLGGPDRVLATIDGEHGATQTFHLHIRSSTGDASLRIVDDYPRERPFLGFRVQELDGQSAAHRGVVPFSGLLVQGTYPQSSAAEAGVLGGDILLALDDRPTVYLAQLADYEATLAPERIVVAKLLRGQTELQVSLRTRVLRERVSESQDVELEPVPAGDRPCAGVVLRSIPPVWSERIFARPGGAVVVTAVDVGSPAWLAGLRGGDVVEAIDAGPVPPAAELARRMQEAAAEARTMQWRVRRGGDDVHDGAVALGDYSGQTVVWVPFVFGLVDGVRRDGWSVGPFGLLLNHRSSYVADNTSRAVATRSSWNALLGLIHVESSPAGGEVRLLWLIRFRT